VSGGSEWFVDAEGVLFSSLDPPVRRTFA